MSTYSPTQRDFRSLSIADLLDAREAYHSHLAHLENVIGTAIGLYRIRKEDPDARGDEQRSRKGAPPRTLQNSSVMDKSWPCVLVFVDKWLSQEELARQDPDQVVPRFLYLPDGRVVPTCVIFAQREQNAPPPLTDLTFPSELVGGGYPVITDEQGQERVGSIGCLVTDGHNTYALTNHHVAGEEGREIFTFVGGERELIGKAHGNMVAKRLFSQVYPGWSGVHTACNLDAGLIRIENLNYWTAQVFGIGALDELVDLNAETIGLNLIGCPVHAFGAASGELAGEIMALFYRFKSLGGVDYVSDVLIGTSDPAKPLGTRPGDSGTVWCFSESPKGENEGKAADNRTRRHRPLALQWGGQVVLGDEGETKMEFALATFLSSICRELDVDILRDWNTGLSDYWSMMGHYKIAAKACDLVADPDLHNLLTKNIPAIAFDDQAITAGKIKKIDAQRFVPLADVSDLVWRNTRKKDSSSHFADMDEEGKDGYAGKTLLDLCQDPANVSIPAWNAFYECLDIKPKDRGSLPFRVWQLYNQMVLSLSQGQVAEFICAGGVLSHYIADACQPLHISKLHHGTSKSEEPVHAKYEKEMLDRFAAEMIAGVNQALVGSSVQPSLQGGKQAALAVVDLMRGTVRALPPLQIVQAFNEAQGRERMPHMWAVLHEGTIACVAAGTRCLASMWASAWKEGHGERIAKNRLVAVERKELKRLYDDKDFVPAFRLTDPQFLEELDRG